MDPLDILKALDGGDAPKTEDLRAAHEELKSALDAATKAERPDLTLAKDLHAGVSKLAAEIKVRDEAEAAEREELAALRKGLFDDTTPAAPAEPAPVDVPDSPARTEEPVAASTGADIVARLTAFASRNAPAAAAPRTVNGTRSRSLGPAAGFELDTADFHDVGALFSTHAKAITNPGQRGHMFRLTREFEESRQLGFNVDSNNQKMMSWFGPGQGKQTPLAAACGLCGPGDVDHTHPICSEDGRPIRDALPQFQA